MADDGQFWGGTTEDIEDPEEKKVICCAVDSFM
jgi:hypothetical protein